MPALTADCVYKYVGVAVVVLFLLYLASRAFTIQASLFTRLFSGGASGSSASGSSTSGSSASGSSASGSSTRWGSSTQDLKEGFTDAANIKATIQNYTNKIDDPLLVTKYKAVYSDVIIALDDNMKTFVLASVLNNAETLSADPGSEENQRLIKSITEVSAFRKTLNEAMGVLNSHK